MTKISLELERVANFVWRLGELDPTDDIDMRALIADARSYREDLEVLINVSESKPAASIWPDNLKPCC